MSLSARRAWIEIKKIGRPLVAVRVALRKESVDRNVTRGQLPTPEPPSLSARRAWIEMLESKQIDPSVMVALRKESVDRNLFYGDDLTFTDGRSPQGERG